MNRTEVRWPDGVDDGESILSSHDVEMLSYFYMDDTVIFIQVVLNFMGIHVSNAIALPIAITIYCIAYCTYGKFTVNLYHKTKFN